MEQNNYIKNMVCDRCIKVLQDKNGFPMIESPGKQFLEHVKFANEIENGRANFSTTAGNNYLSLDFLLLPSYDNRFDAGGGLSARF